jgi:hypothetical protein
MQTSNCWKVLLEYIMIKKTILVEKSRTIVKSKDIDFLKSKLVTRIPDYKSSFLLIYLVFCFSLSVGLLL